MNSLKMTPGILTESVFLRSNTYPGQVEGELATIRIGFLRSQSQLVALAVRESV